LRLGGACNVAYFFYINKEEPLKYHLFKMFSSPEMGGLQFDQTINTYKYNNVPVKITENETSYLFRDFETDELVYFIDYSQLFYKIDNESILKIASMSLGKQIVPTALLMPSDLDTFIHTNIKSNLTSLRQLYAWLRLIIAKINNRPVEEFRPFQKLQIAEVFENLNINEISEENKQCFTDSINLFDFHCNLEKIFWFNTITEKYNLTVPDLDHLHTLHPRDAFMLANNLMRYICVWEAADKNITAVMASNIIFINFLQDTGSMNNAYTPLLPFMQALAIMSTTPASAPYNLSNTLNQKAKLLFNRGKFNRDDNHGFYRFQMKVKNSNKICSREDCLDILQYLFFKFNIFKDQEFDVVIAYMRKVFYFYKRPELYIYIIVFGLSLLSLRVAKPIKNITGTKNLANFNIENIGVRHINAETKQNLYKEMKNDITTIFNFVDPYKNYMLGLQDTNPSFKVNNLSDEVLFYFMKTNNSFSELVNYILKTVLPLITSQLI
jgi:hypothetical protein